MKLTILYIILIIAVIIVNLLTNKVNPFDSNSDDNWPIRFNNTENK